MGNLSEDMLTLAALGILAVLVIGILIGRSSVGMFQDDPPDTSPKPQSKPWDGK